MRRLRTSGGEHPASEEPRRDFVDRVLLVPDVHDGALESREQPTPDGEVTCQNATHLEGGAKHARNSAGIAEAEGGIPLTAKNRPARFDGVQ